MKKSFEILQILFVFFVWGVLIYNFNDFTLPLFKLWLSFMGLAFFVFITVIVPILILLWVTHLLFKVLRIVF